MFFVSVHKGNHIVGGTKEGCNFMEKAGCFHLWDTFHLAVVINA